MRIHLGNRAQNMIAIVGCATALAASGIVLALILTCSGGCSLLQGPVAGAIGAPAPAVVQSAATQAAADQAAVGASAAQVQTLSAQVGQLTQQVAAAATQPGAAGSQQVLQSALAQTQTQLAALQAQSAQQQLQLSTDMNTLKGLLTQTSNAVSTAQQGVQGVGAAASVLPVPGVALLGMPIASLIAALLGLTVGGGGAYAYGNQVAGNQTAQQQAQQLQQQLTTIAQTVASLIPSLHPMHAVALTAALGPNAPAPPSPPTQVVAAGPTTGATPGTSAIGGVSAAT